MIIKKINAVITLLMIALTLDHTASMAAFFFGVKPYDATPFPTAVAFLILFTIHAALSLCLLIFGKSSSEKLYVKQNAQTIEQRISAMVLMVLIHFHIQDKIKFEFGGNLAIFIPEALLILALAAHLGTSTHRAFITLGIEKKWPVIVVKVLIDLVCAAALACLVKFCFFA